MIPACPIAAAREALTLLQTGRAAMALRIMETLPDAIEATLKGAASEAYLRGQTDTHRMMAATRERHRGQRQAAASHETSRLDLHSAALADPIQRQLVKATLGMDDSLLDRIAAGGATLSGAQWRRLREALR